MTKTPSKKYTSGITGDATLVADYLKLEQENKELKHSLSSLADELKRVREREVTNKQWKYYGDMIVPMIKVEEELRRLGK